MTSVLSVYPAIPSITMSNDQGKSDMQRLKNTPNLPAPPRPGGALMAGMLIGTAIMTMAAQAIVLGAGAAIRDAAVRRG
jgi:hypothetical protein